MVAWYQAIKNKNLMKGSHTTWQHKIQQIYGFIPPLVPL